MPRYDRIQQPRSYGERRPPRYGAAGDREPRRGFVPYDYDLGRYGTPFPGAAGYPSARWGWGPIGWAAWGPGMEMSPFAGVPYYAGYGEPYQPRRRPEESPTYGRGGDRAARRWAARYGYDEAYEIQPRRRRR
jgi:hypothetical protein